eukprot:3051076-Prymnesium_polylepis.1
MMTEKDPFHAEMERQIAETTISYDSMDLSEYERKQMRCYGEQDPSDVSRTSSSPVSRSRISSSKRVACSRWSSRSGSRRATLPSRKPTRRSACRTAKMTATGPKATSEKPTATGYVVSVE